MPADGATTVAEPGTGDPLDTILGERGMTVADEEGTLQRVDDSKSDDSASSEQQSKSEPPAKEEKADPTLERTPDADPPKVDAGSVDAKGLVMWRGQKVPLEQAQTEAAMAEALGAAGTQAYQKASATRLKVKEELDRLSVLEAAELQRNLDEHEKSMPRAPREPQPPIQARFDDDEKYLAALDAYDTAHAKWETADEEHPAELRKWEKEHAIISKQAEDARAAREGNSAARFAAQNEGQAAVVDKHQRTAGLQPSQAEFDKAWASALVEFEDRTSPSNGVTTRDADWPDLLDRHLFNVYLERPAAAAYIGAAAKKAASDTQDEAAKKSGAGGPMSTSGDSQKPVSLRNMDVGSPEHKQYMAERHREDPEGLLDEILAHDEDEG